MQAGNEIYLYKNQYLHKGIYLTSVWESINQFENGEFYLIFPISYTTSENETIMLDPGQCCADRKILELRYEELLKEENKEFESLIHHYQSKLDNGIRLINNIK